ncbi:hypothetical protein PI124_g21720 [Phytophthora idaei]|nr:hypothetical protein PI125_g23530 [Phytophthora idaei]KAG3129325.1 hypothetical protein PI126_g21022 [Phytophthora idaei]KAG3233203.1 hypothetical protein PI124_g21720 [Phytophthora idaei]
MISSNATAKTVNSANPTSNSTNTSTANKFNSDRADATKENKRTGIRGGSDYDSDDDLESYDGVSSSDEEHGNDEGRDETETKNKRKKCYFTPADDLALLREILNVQPYAAKHGSKPSCYDYITKKLSEHVVAKLGRCTVQDRFKLLLKEFQGTDCEYRKQSGVAEEYTEHKHLVQDITDAMRGISTKKRCKKEADQARTEQLELTGEKLREQAVQRRCQRVQHTDNDEDGTSDSTVDDGTTEANDTAGTSPSISDDTERRASVGLTTAQVNASTVDFMERPNKRHANGYKLLCQELHFKQVKAAREEAQWEEDMEMRKQEAEQHTKQWSEDVTLRQSE